MKNELKVYIPGKNAKEHTIDFNSVIAGIKGQHQVMYEIPPGENSTITNNTKEKLNVSINSEPHLSNLQIESMEKAIDGLTVLSIVMFISIVGLAYELGRKKNER